MWDYVTFYVTIFSIVFMLWSVKNDYGCGAIPNKCIIIIIIYVYFVMFLWIHFTIYDCQEK